MSLGGANKGGQKRVANRVQENDEDDYQDDSNTAKISKKQRETTYRPSKGDDDDDDDGNQEYERPSRTKNARNAAEDDAQEAEEMR
jgi:hypothetical protein